MKPLSALPESDIRKLQGVLFDLDDTLLTHGTLTREAYGALWDLAESGLRLVAVTGRPSGWGEVLVRQWPIAAAVTENGAVWVVREDKRRVRVVDSVTPEERRARRMRLAHLAEDVRQAVAEATLADDVSARLSDLAWDIAEHRKLAEPQVETIVKLVRQAGGRSTRSSVHVHASFDGYDKASGTLAFLRYAWNEDETRARARYAFVGDSANDAACFAAFAVTIGVANVSEHLGLLSVPPRYITDRARGSGFAELARFIIDHRESMPSVAEEHS